MNTTTTVPQLFWQRTHCEPEKVACYVVEDSDHLGMGTPAPEHPGWVQFTRNDALERCSGLARRLHALGVDRGVTVAILAETSAAWAAIDMAVLCLRGITVGIYPTLLPEQVIQQLRHSEARVLVVENDVQHDRLEHLLEDCPDLVHVLTMTPPEAGSPLVLLTPAASDLGFLEQRIGQVEPEDVATIVYTSGTTGEPKGAQLTHANFMAVVESSLRALPAQPGDRSVAFLPLAHSLQRFACYRGLAEDIIGYFAPSIQALPETIQVARPHVLASVPRMLEKIKAKAEATAAQRSSFGLKVLNWAIGVGTVRNHHLRAGTPVPLGIRLQHQLADRLVYQKVRQRLGGHLRLLISGGAALSVEVAEFFEALGIQVREGWGLTETSAPATANRTDRFRLGTVGLPLDNVEIKLAEDKEVLVRGPGVFKGYFKDPDATAAAFTEDGFFRTGDLGEIDAEGFLRIVGRKKEIIVTAGGKNIAPVRIEKALEGGLVGQAVVVGNERPYLVALLTLEPDALENLAKRRAWTEENLHQRPEVQALVAEQVEQANGQLARFETIKRFCLLPEPLTVENGQLTPTLKLKRRVISDRHADHIDELYSSPS